MAEGFTGLQSALEERDRLLSFASKLEDLQAEGSLSSAEYSTGKSDYDGRIAATTARIGALKSALRKELEASEREAEMCRLKLESAQAHHEAGDLPDAGFNSEKRRWESQLRGIATREDTLQTALTADSAADLEGLVIAPSTEQPSAPVQKEKKSRPPRAIPAHDTRPPTATRGWTRLRIAALVAAAVLLVSVRMAWLAPTELLGKDLGAEAGVSASFLAGMGGILCGLTAIGVSFVRNPRTRGVLQIVAGVLALAALIGAVLLGELPLHDSYFRELIVLREGFFAYVVAALALAVLGFMQRR